MKQREKKGGESINPARLGRLVHLSRGKRDDFHFKISGDTNCKRMIC